MMNLGDSDRSGKASMEGVLDASEHARLLEAGGRAFEQELPKDPENREDKKRMRQNATQIGIVCLCLVLTASMVVYTIWFRPTPPGPRTGAAIVFVHDDEMLLVHRNDSANQLKWGLPGQVRDVDESILVPEVTATATTELGMLTPYVFNAEFTYSLGLEHQEQVWVFVARLTDKKNFIMEPVKNGLKKKWIDVKKIAKMKDLDPLLNSLFNDKGARQMLSVALKVSDPKKLGVKTDKKIEKLGAGLFLKADGDILLLRKNSSNNNGTLTVPGGNTDLTDDHLRHTAEREAVEEMGSCPKYAYKGEIDTKRGKGKKKVFKMFLGTIASDVRHNFIPVLSEESLEWGWYPLKTLHKRKDLHPTVKILVKDHAKKIKKIFD